MTSLNPQGWSSETITQKLMEMVDKQQQLLEAMTKREVKVEGIRLPQFFGKMGESVDLYFEQLAQYFEAKNIDRKNDAQSSRILAITTANFKGNAAAWYKLNKREINDMQDLILKLTDEFVPPDLQERLRDQLYALNQRIVQAWRNISLVSVKLSCKLRT
ncbi:hypothetical protein DVH05_016893 [Phytophthora capsici]|nr:hypothetical protein DVH05_016893 [Phytophthora capsici]